MNAPSSRHGNRHRVALHDRALDVPPKELLLSRYAQGFQISQYDLPINKGGYLDLPDASRVSIERAHLEEDTGKSTHLGGADESTARTVRSWTTTVQVSRSSRSFGTRHPFFGPSARLRLRAAWHFDRDRCVGRTHGRRIDANRRQRLGAPAGPPFGTRCEIKNLNSLRSLQRAIDFEALRQIELIEEGGTIRQETRHWDEDLGETSTMRTKEEAEDYRYFREPDLVDLAPSEQWQHRVRDALPAMPAQRRAALVALLVAPSEAQLDAVAVVVDLGLEQYVHAAVGGGAEAALTLARAANELAAGIGGLANLSLAAFTSTVLLEQAQALSATQAKTVLGELLAHGGDPTRIAATLGFEQLSSDSLGATVASLIDEHPDEWTRYRDGDEKLAQFFIGQVMKLTKGQANGKAVIAELQARRSSRRLAD